MSKKGCKNGCIHYKEIKIKQMKDIYHFRCNAIKKYFVKDGIKSRCNLYQGSIIIKEYTLDDFLNS